MNPGFVAEAAAYALLQRAGWRVPRHGWLGETLPFATGEAVVLKGLGDDLWHKTELGAVELSSFDPPVLARRAEGMRTRVAAAGHRWLGALVCERIAVARNEGLPSEGFVSLSRHAAGWIALVGWGGLQADALAARVPPLCWPLALLTPEVALAELEGHFLGQVWLGTLRGTRPLTDRTRLAEFVASVWKLAALAEAEGIELLELNPIGLDSSGRPCPLDAVGRCAPPPRPRLPAPAGFLSALMAPERVAVAGVSSNPDGLGRIILEKLRVCAGLAGRVIVIKPGQTEFLGLPCRSDVTALKEEPADLLLLALPASAAAGVMTQLLAQQGGARVVALVAGGLGDGADAGGLGAGVAAQLEAARAAGRWTPAVLGPNFLGHWVPATGIDTTFIPPDRLTVRNDGGGLALLAQSGAFMLCRRSRNPRLRLRVGVALGNQLDVALPDYLEALAVDPECRAVAAYVEGFAQAQLAATVRAALALRTRDIPLVMLRAGRTLAGQAAAASHTGAMAGDLVLERELLSRAGVRFADTIAAFDAALAWLSVYPNLRPGPLALITNAGVEAVNASDLATSVQPIVQLPAESQAALEQLIAAEKLAGVVAPRVPLDLTPMASPGIFLRAAELLLASPAQVLVVSLVPFTRNVVIAPSAAIDFARMLARMAEAAGKPCGIVVDSGPEYADYRGLLAESGLPVFSRVEEAIAGLRVLE